MFKQRNKQKKNHKIANADFPQISNYKQPKMLYMKLSKEAKIKVFKIGISSVLKLVKAILWWYSATFNNVLRRKVSKYRDRAIINIYFKNKP